MSKRRTWKEKAGSELAKSEQRRALTKLRAELVQARHRRRLWVAAASKRYRKLRADLMRAQKAERARVLAELRARFEAERAALRRAHEARRARIRAEHTPLVTRRAELLKEARAEQTDVRAASRRLHEASRAVTARERRDESDDAVRNNLPADLIAIFDQVRRTIKAGPRRSRTEAFLEWCEENAQEVVTMQAATADNDVDRMIAETIAHERTLETELASTHKPRRRRWEDRAAVPF